MPAEPSNDYRVVVFGAGGELFVFDVATGQGPASKVLTNFRPGVGKTSLVLRFIHGTFRESYVPTIEDTYRKVIKDQRPSSPSTS